jgi:hypothetical protein
MAFTRNVYSTIKRRRESRRIRGRTNGRNNVTSKSKNKFTSKGIVLRPLLTTEELDNNHRFYEAQEKYKPKSRTRSIH